MPQLAGVPGLVRSGVIEVMPWTLTTLAPGVPAVPGVITPGLSVASATRCVPPPITPDPVATTAPLTCFRFSSIGVIEAMPWMDTTAALADPAEPVGAPIGLSLDRMTRWVWALDAPDPVAIA